MATPHGPFSPCRLKAAQTSPTSLGGSGAIWASLVAHGVLVVGGIGYTAAATLGLATSSKEADISLESEAPAALVATAGEAVPTAPAPLAPAETPLPLDSFDAEPTSEPLPADPVCMERHDPEKDWRPFNGPVVARLRLPAPSPVAPETPETASPPPLPPATLATVQPDPFVAPQPLDHINRRPRPRFGKGEVVVRVDVTANGTVDDVAVVSRSGPKVLATSVISAVRTWRFNPATRDGRAIAHPFTARFVF